MAEWGPAGSRRAAKHLAASAARRLSSLASRLEGHQPAPDVPARRLGPDEVLRTISRSAFVASTQTTLRSRGPGPGNLALFVVDIDQFSSLNDSHGSQIGDEALVAVANRLHMLLRRRDALARVGPDSFAMLISDSDDDTPDRLAQRIHRAFDPPVPTSTGSLRMTVSVGAVEVAQTDAARSEATTLLRQAETAAHRASRAGRGSFRLFDQGKHREALARYRTEHQLRAALLNDELTVHYQPIISLRSGQTVGVEALARWHHAVHGPISPELFIPVAEESGLIDSLGEAVMVSVARQAQRWNAAGTACGLITINLSNRQLLDPDIVPRFESLVHDHDLDARRICVEITESVVMSDVAASMSILSDLKDLGLCLAIDDFGTGYSSLSYLRRLPVDILKIDRSFVQALDHRDDRVITKAIIDLAHTLGMTTIAEGVETRQQLDLLDALECDMAQGYLLHHAVPAAEIDFSAVDLEGRVSGRQVAPSPARLLPL